MTRYAQNGGLTRFDTGSTHEQNPLSGIPIGNNNSVEENETKSGNFIYSNRIFLDSNIISQYNLPKSLVGKSVADATKMIDDKFKGRNDKISQSTKNGMLSKIAEAQEAMKPQEPEMKQPQEGMEQGYPQEMMDNGQMAFGGFADSTIGQGFGEGATGAQQSQAIGAGLGVGMAAFDLGKTAFGKPNIDTSGQFASEQVNSGAMIGGSALKGATAGMAFGPLGAGIGAVVGAGAGLLGSNKAKKAAAENTNNYAINTNKKYSDNYFAYGGQIDPPIQNRETWNTKKIVNYQPGVTSGKNGKDGFYLYSKNQTEPGFNVNRDREFVNQENMMDLQRTPQWREYQQSLQINKSQPIAQFALGGKMNQMENGGDYLKNNRPFYMTNPGLIVPTGQETVSSNKRIPFLKPPTADTNTNVIQNFHDAIGITPDMEGYGSAWGEKSKDLYFKKLKAQSGDNYMVGRPTKEQILKDPLGYTLDSMVKQNSNEDLARGYQFNPETPIFPQKGDPIITPTQTKAGFEAYADVKKVEDAKKNKSLVGKGLSYANDNIGNIARYAPIAANALQLAQLKKPQGERLDRLSNRYNPEYVDEAQLQNIANQTMNNSVNAIGQSGASQGQLRSSIIGSQLQRTKALSDSYAQAAAQNRATNDRAQTFNLGVDQVNLQQSNSEKDINARNQGAYDTEKSKLIGKIGDNIGSVGTEQAYKKIALTTTGYSWLGEFQKMNPNATKEETVIAAKKAGVAIDDKKALGSYLIKNKVK